eukprot:TRINITY_DN5929_c0_g1_i1.p1 TRINITY_DN5929_c0_g1~~TRINITY_DN5929_c0_g1_i1.p1  ORF type:complete len:600 (-),score=129.45 TRINITY_DN5929_c0_g1_i1:51-1850(-)
MTTHEAWQMQRNADKIELLLQSGQRLRDCYIEPTLRKTEILRERTKVDRQWKEFVEDVSYEGVPLYSLEAVYSDVGLRLLAKDLCYDPTAQFPEDAFRDTRYRLADIRGHPNTELHFSVDNFITGVDLVLDALQRTLAEVPADPAPLVALPMPVFDYVAQILELSPFDPTLSEIQSRIKQREEQLAQSASLEESALDDGDLTTVQEQLIQEVTLREDLLAHIDEKLAVLQASEDAHNEYAVVSDVCQRVLSECAEYRAQQDRLADACRQEVSSLQRFVTDMSLAAQQRRSAAAQRFLESERFMRDTSTQEEHCWQQIRSLELDLANLAERRYQHLRERTQDVDEMALQDERHHQLVAVSTAHRLLLERTARTCDLAAQAMRELEREIVVNGCNFVAARRAHALRSIDENRLECTKEQFQHFHTTYIDLNTLLRIKEKYLQILYSDAERSMQMEWLTKPYRDRLSDDIVAIKRKQEELLERFQPTMNFLRERDIPFDHPVQTSQGSAELLKYLEQVTTIIQYQKDQKSVAPPVDVTALDGPAPSPSMPQLNPGTPKRGYRTKPGMPVPAIYSPRTPRDKRIPNAKSSPRIRTPTRRLPAV